MDKQNKTETYYMSLGFKIILKHNFAYTDIIIL